MVLVAGLRVPLLVEFQIRVPDTSSHYELTTGRSSWPIIYRTARAREENFVTQKKNNNNSKAAKGRGEIVPQSLICSLCSPHRALVSARPRSAPSGQLTVWWEPRETRTDAGFAPTPREMHPSSPNATTISHGHACDSVEGLLHCPRLFA